MKKTLICFSAFAGLILITAQAHAAVFQAHLRGTEEVPPNSSSATGFATAELFDSNTKLRVNVTYSGLTAPTTASHIHCCTLPGMNTGVALDFAGLTPAGTSASFIHTFMLDISLAAGFVANYGNSVDAAAQAFVFGLLSGGAYVNVHNSAFPGGEIRGQLLPVPEPGTAMLLMGALLATPLIRRKTS